MNTEITTMPIPVKLFEQIEQIAEEQKRNNSEVIEEMIKDYQAKNEVRKKPRNTPEKEKQLLRKLALEQREEILEKLDYQVDLWNEDNFTE